MCVCVCVHRAAFYKLAIPAEDTSVLPYIKDLLTTQGRMKFLRYMLLVLHPCTPGTDNML